jgi:hypothetical protein
VYMLMSLVELKPEKVCADQTGRQTSTISQMSKNNKRKKENRLVACTRWVPDTKTDWSTGHLSQYNFDPDLFSSIYY